MPKFSMGSAGAIATRSETGPVRVAAPAGLKARANANLPGRFAGFRGYAAILAFLTLVAVGSMSVALWRLFTFAR
ncbi:MAG: hypothetical protein QM651_17010 [Rhodoblastus sp.]